MEGDIDVRKTKRNRTRESFTTFLFDLALAFVLYWTIFMFAIDPEMLEMACVVRFPETRNFLGQRLIKNQSPIESERRLRY